MNAPLALLRLPRPRAAASLTLGALVVLMGVGLTVTSNVLIARAGFHPGLETLALLIVGVRFFGISRAAVRYLERLVSHDLTFRALEELRVRLFTRLEQRPSASLALTQGGDVLERFLGDVDTLQNAWLRALAPQVVAVVVAGLTAVGLLLVHPLLGLVALTGFLLCGAAIPFVAGRAARRSGARLAALRGAHTARLQDALEGATDLLTLGALLAEQNALEMLTRDIARAQVRLGRLSAVANGAGNATAWLTALGFVAVAAPLANAGRVSPELLGALAFGTLASFEALLGLGAAATALERTRQAANRIAQTLDAPTPETSRREAVPIEATALEPRRPAVLRFEQVGFAFSGAPVLEDIDFTLEPGRWLAVVGHTGAGKSTLARLALRLCEPTRGRITLGGTDLRDLTPEAVRTAIAWMPQRGHVFETSLRQNLRIARPDASDDALWAALEVAELAATVRGLPDGLDTVLERDGARLSGGERQRLLLARAWLRDPDVLILDEPTANLDHETERVLMATLRRVTRLKAVLLITHRLHILEPTDDAIALEAGRVVARGKAGALLRGRL